MTTRIKRLRKKVLVSVFKGTNKYAEAIRNSGTAGRHKLHGLNIRSNAPPQREMKKE